MYRFIYHHRDQQSILRHDAASHRGGGWWAVGPNNVFGPTGKFYVFFFIRFLFLQNYVCRTTTTTNHERRRVTTEEKGWQAMGPNDVLFGPRYVFFLSFFVFTTRLIYICIGLSTTTTTNHEWCHLGHHDGDVMSQWRERMMGNGPTGPNDASFASGPRKYIFSFVFLFLITYVTIII